MSFSRLPTTSPGSRLVPVVVVLDPDVRLVRPGALVDGLPQVLGNARVVHARPRSAGARLEPASSESALSATTLKAPWPPLASCSTRSDRQELPAVLPSVAAPSCPPGPTGAFAFSWATAKPPAAWLWAALPLASSRPLRTCPMTTKPSSSTTPSDISSVPATTLSWMFRRHSRTAGSSGRRTQRIDEPQHRATRRPVLEQPSALEQTAESRGLTPRSGSPPRTDSRLPGLRSSAASGHVSSARPCNRHHGRSPRSPGAPGPSRPWSAAAVHAH